VAAQVCGTADTINIRITFNFFVYFEASTNPQKAKGVARLPIQSVITAQIITISRKSNKVWWGHPFR